MSDGSDYLVYDSREVCSNQYELCVCDVILCCALIFFFLMIRRPPRSTQSRSSAASDVYKRQTVYPGVTEEVLQPILESTGLKAGVDFGLAYCPETVSYTHLRAHETPEQLVCRLLLEKKKTRQITSDTPITSQQPS